MMTRQTSVIVQTNGRGFYPITALVSDWVQEQLTDTGMLHLWIQHTSASLVTTENADPDVLVDLNHFMEKLVPDGDPQYLHSAEGPDDMPAHIRSVLTQTSLTVPVISGRLALGTWQGLFIWEHRTHPHRRSVILTMIGN